MLTTSPIQSNYRKGVLTDDGDCACTTVACIDHAILMVGYDDTAEIPYSKIKKIVGYHVGRRRIFPRRPNSRPGHIWFVRNFGGVSESVVATGHNTTGMVKDEKKMSPIRQCNAILLLTCASLFAFYIFFVILFFRAVFSNG